MCVTMTWDTVCDNVTTMSTGILKMSSLTLTRSVMEGKIHGL